MLRLLDENREIMATLPVNRGDFRPAGNGRFVNKRDYVFAPRQPGHARYMRFNDIGMAPVDNPCRLGPDDTLRVPAGDFSVEVDSPAQFQARYC